MNDKTLAGLIYDIREAERHGKRKAAGVEDGGSCNLDRVILYRDRQSKKMEAALKEAGIPAWWCKREGGYSVCINTDGQAAKRTVAVEAAVEHLHSRGWRAEVHYITD